LNIITRPQEEVVFLLLLEEKMMQGQQEQEVAAEMIFGALAKVGVLKIIQKRPWIGDIYEGHWSPFVETFYYFEDKVVKKPGQSFSQGLEALLKSF